MNYSISELLDICRQVSSNIYERINSIDDIRQSGLREGQYFLDIVADNSALDIFKKCGISVLSEESGITDNESEYLAILDPIDGSTNASNGLPLFCTSILILRHEEPVFGFIDSRRLNFEIYSGGNGVVVLNNEAVGRLPQVNLEESIISYSGYPREWGGWKQSRSFGSAALEIAFVATGSLGAYFDASHDGLAIWDYAAGIYIAESLGYSIDETLGRELYLYDIGVRRHPIVGQNEELVKSLKGRLSKTRAGQRNSEILKLLAGRLKQTDDPQEREIIEKLRQLLKGNGDIYSPEVSNSHITGSAVIISDRGILLHEHIKLKIWVQPGGHLDYLETPSDAAKREAFEETGISPIDKGCDPILLHVAEVKGADGHIHFDMRFLFYGDGKDPAPPPSESQKVEWFDFDSALEIVDEPNRQALIEAQKYLINVAVEKEV